MDIFEEIVKIRAKGGTAALATVTKVEGSTPRIEGAKMLIKNDGNIVGSIGGGSVEAKVCREAVAVMKEGKPRMIHADLTGKKVEEEGMLCGGKMEVFVEPIVANTTMYIFGAGHISFFISKIGKILGFRIVVIDDRDEFANAQRFVEADEIIAMDFEAAFDRININRSSYIIIVTRGHLHDEKVLKLALQTEAKYVGMIGSKKKIRTVYSHLEEQGVDRKQLDSVHAPIGLEIHAETPEEIAISILAEIIMVQRGKQVTGS